MTPKHLLECRCSDCASRTAYSTKDMFGKAETRTWEYDVTYSTDGTTLDEIGAKGWELIAIFWHSAGYYEGGYYTYFWKRVKA